MVYAERIVPRSAALFKARPIGDKRRGGVDSDED